MVGEDPNGYRGDVGDRYTGGGKSGGRKGKSICSRKAEGAVLCTSSHYPINFVSDREQRPELTYSTLFVGLTLSSVIRITPLHHLTDKVSTLGAVSPVTHGQTRNSQLFLNVFVCSQWQKYKRTALAPPLRPLFQGFSECFRFRCRKEDSRHLMYEGSRSCCAASGLLINPSFSKVAPFPRPLVPESNCHHLVQVYHTYA